jgi:hypothetical protein
MVTHRDSSHQSVNVSIEGYLYACDNSGYSLLVECVSLVDYNLVKTLDVMNQRVQIRIRNGGSTAMTVQVAVYLVA